MALKNQGDLIVTDGNVGIGTTSPSAPLDIESGSSSISGNNGLKIKKNGNTRAALTNTESDYGRLILYDNSTNLKIKIDAFNTSFFNGGNVGIGTTSPSDKLEVNGNIRGVAGYYGNGTSIPLRLRSTGGSRGISLHSSDKVKRGELSWNIAAFLIRNTNSDNLFYVNFSNGNTGIGTDSPSDKLEVNGSFSATSKNFKIDHPLASKKDTHKLVHASIEAPRADLMYSGMVQLVDGTATVNIDTASNITDGTFEALVGNVRRFCTNEGGFTRVKSSIEGNLLTVVAEDPTCTDEIFWQVIGERKDAQMLESNSTDDNGNLIVEPEIIVEDDI